MAFQPVPQCAQMTVIQRLFDQEVNNTFHFLTPDVNDPTTLNDLADKGLVWWGGEVMPLLSGDLTLERVETRSLETQLAPFGQATPPAPIAGSAASPGLPGSVALAVARRTSLLGRSARGRVFIAGLYESGVSGNEVEVALRNNLTAALNLTLDPAFFSGFTHVLVSRRTNNTDRPQGLTISIGEYLVVDPFVDTQRRRAQNRGI